MPRPPLPNIVATVAAAWGCGPDPVASGTGEGGMHLSVLEGNRPVAQEASAAASMDYHTLCFPLRRYTSEVVLDGRRGEAAVVHPGELCIVPAGRQPWGLNVGPWRSLHVYLPVETVTAVLEAEGVGLAGAGMAPGKPSGFRDGTIERLCRALLDEMGGERPFSRLRIDCLGQDLAIGLLRARLPGLPHHGGGLRRSSGGLAPWQLRRARDAMADDHALSLADLARHAGCSPTHFSRAFKRSTGLSPSTWMRQQRLPRAEALLSDPRLTLAEVALAVGFSAQSHFTTAFKRATGLTPGAWRRERSR